MAFKKVFLVLVELSFWILLGGKVALLGKLLKGVFRLFWYSSTNIPR